MLIIGGTVKPGHLGTDDSDQITQVTRGHFE